MIALDDEYQIKGGWSLVDTHYTDTGYRPRTANVCGWSTTSSAEGRSYYEVLERPVFHEEPPVKNFCVSRCTQWITVVLFFLGVLVTALSFLSLDKKDSFKNKKDIDILP